MHGVAGRVAVGDDQAAGAVEFAPIGLVAGKAVDGVEGRSRVGVDVVRALAEPPRKIHAHQGGGIALVVGESDLPQVGAARAQRLAEQVGLGAFAGTVQPFKDDQLTHAARPP